MRSPHSFKVTKKKPLSTVIKKKVARGKTNGGTYYSLSASVPHAVPYNTWQHIKATLTQRINYAGAFGQGVGAAVAGGAVPGAAASTLIGSAFGLPPGILPTW